MKPIGIFKMRNASVAIGGDDDTGGHRYWRLLNPYALSDTYMGFGELELMGTAGIDRTDPALAVAQASASAFQTTGTEGHQAFDDSIVYGAGSDFNFWQTSVAANTWIKWDFGAGVSKNIVRVRIYPDLEPAHEGIRTPDCIYVQYSDDNSAWTTAWVINARWTNSAPDWGDFTKQAIVAWDFSAPPSGPWASNDFGGSAGTLRMTVPAVRFAGIAGATSFTLGFKSGSAGCTLAHLRVGLNTSTVAFQSSPTPVFATFGGNASSGAIGANTSFETDPITFTLGSTDLCVAAYFSAAGSTLQGLGLSGWVSTWYRAGTDDTANNSPSGGYGSIGALNFIRKLSA